MPKKANSKYTGFYWYMQEIIPDLRRQGRCISNGIADVVPVARPLWKQLSPQERAKYDAVAKEMKRRDKEAGATNMVEYGEDSRLDNVGNKISERVDKAEDSTNKRLADKTWAKSRWPETLEEMKDVKFYFISFNYFLEINGDYIPREIGLVEWSMNGGISKELHAFIDPGGIPMGYRFHCQNRCDTVHGIPIENFPQAESNYRALWQRIVNFVNPNAELFESPPLYCMSTEMEYGQVTSQLDWLFQFSCVRGLNPLSRVFSLEDLVVDLSRLPRDQPISQASAVNILTTTMFDYEPNTMCDFHHEIENLSCALLHVKRYAYALADHFNTEDYYDFKLTAKHLPQRGEDSVVTVIEPPSIGAKRGGEGGSAWHSWRGAGDDTSRGAFAATDIRYPKVEPVVIEPSDSDDDTLDTDSQYSYSAQQQRKQMLNPDQYSAPSSTWKNAAATKTRPDVHDESEFPVLGGSAKAAVKPAPPQDDVRSIASGWQPSAHYLEARAEVEEDLQSVMSLDESMARRELDNELSDVYLGRKEKDRNMRQPQRGGRGSSNTSYSQLANQSSQRPSGMSQSGPRTASRGRGSGAFQPRLPADSSVDGHVTGSNTSGWTTATSAGVRSQDHAPSQTQGVGTQSGGSENSAQSASNPSNPWAGGARRAAGGAITQGLGMPGLGRGRGVLANTTNLPKSPGSVSSSQSVTSSPSSQSSGPTKRPPGLGRGILRGGFQ